MCYYNSCVRVYTFHEVKVDSPQAVINPDHNQFSGYVDTELSSPGRQGKAAQALLDYSIQAYSTRK